MNGVAWRPRANPWAIAMTVTLATFMEVLDTSIANVALPHIAGSLAATVDESTWVLTSYLVSNAVVLPVSGWIAARVGRRRFYMSCVALFTMSSFACGLAPNLPSLIVFRVLQGAGGGGLQPSEQAILADTFPQEKRGMAFAIYGMAVVLAPAIGPTLGGYITDHASWRWIFFINVPVGAASLLLTRRLVEDPPWARPGAKAGARIDYVGFALIVLGLGALQVMLDKGERDDWFSSRLIVAMALLAAAALTAMVIWEWRHAHPIIELKLLARRNFAVSWVLMLMLGMVLFSSTVLLPQYLQTVMGYTAQQAGEVMSPGGLVVLALLPLVGRLIGKVDARWLIGFGFVVTAMALSHMTSIYPGISFRTAMLYRAYQAVGLAFLFVPINTVSYVGVPAEKNNEVSGLINLARNLGGSVGISLAQTLLARRAQVHQTRLVEHVTGWSAPLARLLGGLEQALAHQGTATVEATRRAYGTIYALVQQQAGTLAFIDVIRLLSLACILGVPLTILLQRSKSAPAMH
jgi:MFS transporter, DHA2 family, multidrug resistance protein